MRPATRWLMVFGVSGALVFATTTAAAQNVQRFDDQAGGGEETGVVLPGAPAPEQQQPEPQVVEQQPADGQEEGQEGPAASYRVNVYQGGGGGAAAPGYTPGRTASQDLLNREDSELYQGIIPGDRDDIPHIQALREASQGEPTVISWVGFKPEDERTRVFFQSSSPVQYQVDEEFEDGKLVVTFDNATVPERNFTRFIDARHFDRTVERIEVEELRGGNVEVTLQLNEDLVPSTTTDGQYLYLDFPHEEPGVDDATADAE